MDQQISKVQKCPAAPKIFWALHVSSGLRSRTVHRHGGFWRLDGAFLGNNTSYAARPEPPEVNATVPQKALRSKLSRYQKDPRIFSFAKSHSLTYSIGHVFWRNAKKPHYWRPFVSFLNSTKVAVKWGCFLPKKHTKPVLLACFCYFTSTKPGPHVGLRSELRPRRTKAVLRSLASWRCPGGSRNGWGCLCVFFGFGFCFGFTFFVVFFGFGFSFLVIPFFLFFLFLGLLEITMFFLILLSRLKQINLSRKDLEEICRNWYRLTWIKMFWNPHFPLCYWKTVFINLLMGFCTVI